VFEMAMHEHVLDCDQTASIDALAGDRDRLLQMLETYRTLAEQIHKPRATRRLLMTGLGFSAAELRSASERPEESASL
jgi:hypothetical protein